MDLGTHIAHEAARKVRLDSLAQIIEANSDQKARLYYELKDSIGQTRANNTFRELALRNGVCGQVCQEIVKTYVNGFIA